MCTEDVATKFLLGGGGGRIHRHPDTPTQQICFSSNFGHFIFKMLENAKFYLLCMLQKISSVLGDVSRIFLDWVGARPNVPFTFDAHGVYLLYKG